MPNGPDDDDYNIDGDHYKSSDKHNRFAKRRCGEDVGREPKNAEEMFRKSYKDSNGRRWYKDKNGTIHRFKGANKEYHWNGSFDKKHYPDFIDGDVKEMQKGDIDADWW